MGNACSKIEDALQALAEGRIVIVVDDEQRENEGDFVAAADRVTPETIEFMITHGRGQVCMPIMPDLARRLDLRPILPAIRTDVLLIQGGRDRLVTRRHYEALRGGLPGAEGIVLPGVGHLAHYTHAEELTRLISGGTVTVNGAAAFVSGNQFTARVPLAPGSNTLSLQANTSAGSSSQVLHVTRADVGITISDPVDGATSPDTTTRSPGLIVARS